MPSTSIGREEGYTLTEILIVTAIVTVLLGAALSLSAGLIHSARLQAESAHLVQSLRFAQAAAFSRQKDCTLEIDVAAGRCSILQGGRVLRRFVLEDGVQVIPGLCTYPVRSGILKVIFTPQYGIPRSGGSIALRGAGYLRRLIVSAVTGRVRTE